MAGLVSSKASIMFWLYTQCSTPLQLYQDDFQLHTSWWVCCLFWPLVCCTKMTLNWVQADEFAVCFGHWYAVHALLNALHVCDHNITRRIWALQDALVLQNQLLPSIKQLLQREQSLPVVQTWGRVASSDFCVYGTKLTKGMLHMTTIAGMKARYNRYLQVEQQAGNRDGLLFRLCWSNSVQWADALCLTAYCISFAHFWWDTEQQGTIR